MRTQLHIPGANMQYVCLYFLYLDPLNCIGMMQSELGSSRAYAWSAFGRSDWYGLLSAEWQLIWRGWKRWRQAADTGTTRGRLLLIACDMLLCVWWCTPSTRLHATGNPRIDLQFGPTAVSCLLCIYNQMRTPSEWIILKLPYVRTLQLRIVCNLMIVPSHHGWRI
jgi:hypothetical protein